MAGKLAARMPQTGVDIGCSQASILLHKSHGSGQTFLHTCLVAFICAENLLPNGDNDLAILSIASPLFLTECACHTNCETVEGWFIYCLNLLLSNTGCDCSPPQLLHHSQMFHPSCRPSRQLLDPFTVGFRERPISKC